MNRKGTRKRKAEPTHGIFKGGTLEANRTNCEEWNMKGSPDLQDRKVEQINSSSRQARAKDMMTGYCTFTGVVSRKIKPSSWQAKGDGVWDFVAQKVMKPPDTHFVLG